MKTPMQELTGLLLKREVITQDQADHWVEEEKQVIIDAYVDKDVNCDCKSCAEYNDKIYARAEKYYNSLTED